MARSRNPRVEYRCSFCGKHQEQVKRLIAGPGGVYICDECIELCQEIIADEERGRSEASKDLKARESRGRRAPILVDNLRPMMLLAHIYNLLLLGAGLRVAIALVRFSRRRISRR